MTKVIMVTAAGRRCGLLPDLTPLREAFDEFQTPWQGAKNTVNGDCSLEEEDMDRKLIEFSRHDEVTLASFPEPPEENGAGENDGRAEAIRAVLSAKAALDTALKALGQDPAEELPF